MAEALLATLSPCGNYRYTLRRSGLLTGHGRVTWIMLNPSTADAWVDDPTIRKVRKYTERWRYRELVVVNAYAWRSTDPHALLGVPDPVGPDNDEAIRGTLVGVHWTDRDWDLPLASDPLVVCAWGKHLRPDRRAGLARLLAGVPLYALKLNNDGSPSHPLYLSDALSPIPFTLEDAPAKEGT